jgi:hypothetical protein
MNFKVNLFAFACMLLCMQATYGQSFKIKVNDAHTGVRVQNSTLEIGNQHGARQRTLKADQHGQYVITKAAKSGVQTFLFRAEGYQPISTYFDFSQGEDLDIEILMSPIIRKSFGSKQRKTGANQMGISGVVTDEQTGQPMAGVKVRIGLYETYSDAEGYFSIAYDLPTSAQRLRQTENLSNITREGLSFSKQGFQTKSYENVLVLPDQKFYKVALSTSKANQRSVAAYNLAHGLEVAKSGETYARASVKVPALIKEALLPNKHHQRAVVPASIRVGVGCSCNSCGSVRVMTLEKYVESGLNDEWIASWVTNSLKSGAVAYRSYGANHVIRPINSNYDISNTTCRQVWDADESTNCVAAARATAGEVLVRECNTDKIAFTEYSAENNNSGCGDGYSGTGGTGFKGLPCSATSYSGWPCIKDDINRGKEQFGHGRGLSQWGSQRWASQRGKSYQWILDHYYNPGGIVRGGGTAVGGFADLRGHWAEQECRYMIDNNIMSGYPDETFRPNNAVTRAEFAAMLVSVLNPKQSTNPTIANRNFNDISGHWAASRILRAARSGYMSGYPDGTFRPNNNITRVEIYAALQSGLGIATTNLSLLNKYADQASIASWARGAIAKATQGEIIHNYPSLSQLNPARNASRAEAAAALYQMLVRKGSAPNVNNPYLVKAGSNIKTTSLEIANNELPYPNPVKGLLNLKLNTGAKEMSQYVIFNSTNGTVAAQGRFEGKLLRVDVSRLATGNYIIQIKNAQGITQHPFLKR